jgi:hypothetical protein
MVEESTAASHSLETEAQELSRLMAQFKTHEGEAEGRLSTRAAPKVAAAGGPRLVASNQDWEEF